MREIEKIYLLSIAHIACASSIANYTIEEETQRKIERKKEKESE